VQNVASLGAFAVGLWGYPILLACAVGWQASWPFVPQSLAALRRLRRAGQARHAREAPRQARPGLLCISGSWTSGGQG
jgi:hypothetical protein